MPLFLPGKFTGDDFPVLSPEDVIGGLQVCGSAYSHCALEIREGPPEFPRLGSLGETEWFSASGKPSSQPHRLPRSLSMYQERLTNANELRQKLPGGLLCYAYKLFTQELKLNDSRS